MQLSTIDQASKKDLEEELTKIKLKEKKAKEATKQKTEKMLETGATLATAFGLSTYLGGIEKEVRKANADFDDKTQEEQAKLLAEKQTVAGFDIDLLVGIGGLAVGMTEAAGASSDLFSAAGAGALAAYLGRTQYAKAAHAPDEEQSE